MTAGQQCPSKRLLQARAWLPTLSVSISAISSPALTASPSFFFHDAMLPGITRTKPSVWTQSDACGSACIAKEDPSNAFLQALGEPPLVNMEVQGTIARGSLDAEQQSANTTACRQAGPAQGKLAI